jgi:hypothetical protein
MTSPSRTLPPSQRETPAPEPPQAFPRAFQKEGASSWCRWCGADLPRRAKSIRIGRRFCDAQCKAEHDADVRGNIEDLANASGEVAS